MIKYSIVSRETFVKTEKLIEKFRDELTGYLDQLLWWNERVNLMSRDVSRETIWKHIRHSLLLSQFDFFKDANLIVDTGTGGGLPGIPLATTSPEKHFILNDIVTKKVLAVKQMAQKAGLKNVEIREGSIAKIEVGKPFLLVSKHAFKIDELWDMVWDKTWTSMVFFKGEDFEDELAGITDSISVEKHVLDEGSVDNFYQGKAIVLVTRH